MIPDNKLASEKVPAPYLNKRRVGLLEDYEQGGVALQDPSQGLLYQTWHCFLEGNDIKAEAPNTVATTLLSAPDVEQVSLAFDQNMQPNVAYVSAGQAYWWWYDTTTQSHQTMTMASDVLTPRATLDDKRTPNLGNSDIIISYIRGTSLYYRQQRDRYATEYFLEDNVGDALIDIQMASNLRLQWILSRHG